MLFNDPIINSHHLPHITKDEKIKILAFSAPTTITYACPITFVQLFEAQTITLGLPQTPHSTLRRHLQMAIGLKRDMLSEHGEMKTFISDSTSRWHQELDIQEFYFFLHDNSYPSPSEKDRVILSFSKLKHKDANIVTMLKKEKNQKRLMLSIETIEDPTTKETTKILSGSQRIANCALEILLTEFNAERMVMEREPGQAAPKPFSMYFVKKLMPPWIREISVHDLVNCACAACVNISNAVHLANELLVQSGEIEQPISKNSLLKLMFQRKGCTTPDFVTESGYIFKAACYMMSCDCDPISKTSYSASTPLLYPKLLEFAKTHQNRVYTLHEVQKPEESRIQKLGPDQETIIKLGMKDMWFKCADMIELHQSHYYEAVKSHLAIKKLRAGLGQKHNEIVLEADFSEEYTQRSGSIGGFHVFYTYYFVTHFQPH